MQQWEYTTGALVYKRGALHAVRLDAQGRADAAGAPLPEVLDRLGADGWELVGVHSLGSGVSGHLIFKRPKP